MSEHNAVPEHHVTADTETLHHAQDRGPNWLVLAAAALACIVSGASIAGGVGTYFVLQYRVAQVETALASHKSESDKARDARDVELKQLEDRVRTNEAAADKRLQRVDDRLDVILGRLTSIESKLDAAADQRRGR